MNAFLVNSVRRYATLPRMYYNFVKLRDLHAIDSGREVDIIAVVKEIEDQSRTVVDRYAKSQKMKEVTLVDDSMASVRLTLWGKHSKLEKKEEPMVVVAKGLRVSDYRQKSLSTGRNTKLTGRATFAEARLLKEWWTETGSKEDEEEFAKLTKPSDYQLDARQEVKTVKQAVDMKTGYHEPFTVKAAVLDVNADECIYKSCPYCGVGLSYPWIDPVTKLYTCQKCEKQFKKFRPKMRLRLDIGDLTLMEFKTVLVYDEVGKKILGINVHELADLCKPEHEYWFSQLFRGIVFKTYLFRVKRRKIDMNKETFLRDEWVCYDLRKVPTEPTTQEFLDDITKPTFMGPDISDRPAEIWEADGDGSDSDAPEDYYFDIGNNYKPGDTPEVVSDDEDDGLPVSGEPRRTPVSRKGSSAQNYR